MNAFETIFLGFVQGLTEFLPVSSSGHLVIFQNLLGFGEPELLLDCSLHMGTLLALCIYFRSSLKEMAKETWQGNLKGPNGSLMLWVLVGSIPTGIIALIFKTSLEGLFGSITTVGMMLLATGIIVASTRLIPKGYGTRTRLGLLVALSVGIAQGLAIIPGISRSGATIVCGLFLGMDRESAARFSFLLSIPAIIGALVMHLNSDAIARVGLPALFFGLVSSALVGFFALKLLMGMVRKGHLYYFAPYCWAVGLLVVLTTLD